MSLKNNLSQSIIRIVFILWAKTRLARGYLYQSIEKKTGSFPRGQHFLRTLFNGVRIQCDLNDHVQQQIYFFGAYESVDCSLFLDLIKEGNTVIDAGANIGFYSLMIAQKVGPSGQVHSFEPVPKTFEKLKANIQLNPQLEKCIRPQNLALWHQREELRFTLSDAQANNIGSYTASGKGGSHTEVVCQAFTLADYFQENGLKRLDAIKMDIEGAELRALQGALPVLQKYRPIVLLEVLKRGCQDFGYSPNDLWDVFKNLDYRAYRIGFNASHSGFVDNFKEIEQNNVILLPKEKAGFINTNWDDRELQDRYLSYS